MGTDIVTQVSHMPGIKVSAIAEVHIEAPERALKIAGHGADSFAIAETASKFASTLEMGKTVITPDSCLICTSDQIDVIIDATGRPAVGAAIGLKAMQHGKHLVMMNVEADVTIGAYLQH